MLEIYKNILKIKKVEFLLFLITFLYVFLKNLFLQKLTSFYFFVFLFEVYFTISVYYGLKKSVYSENFKFPDVFKMGWYYFPSILLYNLFVGFSGGIVYLIVTGLINSIKTFSGYSFFLFILIILWASFPLFFLFLTLYTPFVIMAKDEKISKAINESVKFMRENLSFLIYSFFPLLILWVIFFTIFQKYDKILSLKIVSLGLMAFLEILTIKLIFLIYKGVENERNF